MKGRSLVFLFFLAPLFAYAEGFDENYQVYSGDINNDGLTDFYISNKTAKFVPIISKNSPVFVRNARYNSDVSNFALIQNSDKTFNIKPSFSVAEQALVDQWASSTVNIVLGDFNLDGIIDILLKDVASIISNVLDQIIFAPVSKNAPPQAIREVDNGLSEFFEEVHYWTVNEDYFDDNAPVITQPVTISDVIVLPEWCASPAWVSENGPLSNLAPIPTVIRNSLDEIYDDRDDYLTFCYGSGRTVIHYDVVSVQYDIAVGVKDYSIFNQEALALTRAVEKVTDIDSTVIDPTTQDGEAIRSIFEAVLGASVPSGRFGAVILTEVGNSSAGPWVWEDDIDKVNRLPFAWLPWIISILNSASSAPRPNCETFYRGDDVGKTEFWAPLITESLQQGKSLGEAKNIAYDLLKNDSFDSLAFEHALDSFGSPYVSVTTNIATAGAYAAGSPTGGEVYKISLPAGMPSASR